MSTKIPKYLAGGYLHFCFGLHEIGCYQFVEGNECGLMVDVQNRSELVAALRRILQDANLRARLGANAWATAGQRFDAPKVRERFRGVIAQAA
jgi:glycosyltransferase involved in cell wall biosynthesis